MTNLLSYIRAVHLHGPPTSSSWGKERLRPGLWVEQAAGPRAWLRIALLPQFEAPLGIQCLILLLLRCIMLWDIARFPASTYRLGGAPFPPSPSPSFFIFLSFSLLSLCLFVELDFFPTLLNLFCGSIHVVFSLHSFLF